MKICRCSLHFKNRESFLSRVSNILFLLPSILNCKLLLSKLKGGRKITRSFFISRKNKFLLTTSNLDLNILSWNAKCLNVSTLVELEWLCRGIVWTLSLCVCYKLVKCYWKAKVACIKVLTAGVPISLAPAVLLKTDMGFISLLH